MAAPSSVSTIRRVAKMLGEDEDLLHDIAIDLDPEDGCLTVRPDLNSDFGNGLAD